MSSFEQQVISYVKSRIKRGQINVIIDFSNNELSSGNKVIIDRELAKEYWYQLESLRDELSLTDQINLVTLVTFPGVVTIEESKEDVEQLWSATYQALNMAVDQFIRTREIEGSAMLLDINERLESMSQLIDKIKTRSPLVLDEYRQRLQKRLIELTQNQSIIDESRLAMEVAIMADKCDVTEELVRLRSHISQMQDSLVNSDDPIGRQLDFILQEINREVNTISSKANDYQITSDCIQFKYEIEKVREQVQNIE
jgi:uncharacterized protein (TIGR00255 family)